MNLQTHSVALKFADLVFQRSGRPLISSTVQQNEEMIAVLGRLQKPSARHHNTGFLMLRRADENIGDRVFTFVDVLDEIHAFTLPRLTENTRRHLRDIIAAVHIATKFLALGDRPRR